LEVAASDGHNHVDGIEVLLTPKTPGQVSFGVGGSVELGAQGTEKAEIAIRDLAGKAKEVRDEASNGDVVSKYSEFILRITASHKVLLWKMEFGHGVGDKSVVDSLKISRCRIEQASCGDVIDLARDPAT
jgi:hypothetical protein